MDVCILTRQKSTGLLVEIEIETAFIQIILDKNCYTKMTNINIFKKKKNTQGKKL